MSSSVISRLTSSFEAASRVPVLAGARIDPCVGGRGKEVLVTSKWTQAANSSNRKVSFATIHAVDKEDLSCSSGPSPALPLAEDDLQATRGNLRVQIQKSKADGKDLETLNIFDLKVRTYSTVLFTVRVGQKLKFLLPWPKQELSKISGEKIGVSSKKTTYYVFDSLSSS